jgi:hypothetical protein
MRASSVVKCPLTPFWPAFRCVSPAANIEIVYVFNRDTDAGTVFNSLVVLVNYPRDLTGVESKTRNIGNSLRFAPMP